MKKQFSQNGEQYQAYWNEKEYNGKVYFSANRVGGSYQYKGSYSKSEERFVDYKAGELDTVRATAKALGFTE